MRIDFICQNTQKIVVEEKNKVQYLALNEIIYLECNGYITTINTTSRGKITVSKLLKDFELELANCGFIRANRSVLVNLAFVKQYQGGCNRLLELLNGEKLFVSRRRVFQFRMN